MVRWEQTVLPEVRKKLTNFDMRGINPSLRTMFYALFGSHVFPNTENYYKSLSHYTTIWREDGTLPPNCFVDDSRYVVEDFDDIYETPQDYIDRLIGYLEDAAYNYANGIPHWHNQPEYVEVWTEKKADISLLRSILRGRDDRHVRIVPSAGFSGPGFNVPNSKRLLKWQRQGKNIHIIYVGDLDPSGEDIDRVIKKKLEKYGLVGIDFQRIAVTYGQMVDYDLPRNPDPITLGKLKNDSRKDTFKKKYNLQSDDDLFQIEVDAFAGKEPDAFKELLLQSVDQFYDEDIYNEALTEYSEDDINKIRNKSVRDLARRL